MSKQKSETKAHTFRRQDGEKYAVFSQHKGKMMALSYRMLGSVSEAEDLLQETFIEWNAVESKDILSPQQWLMKVCSRKCLDFLSKAYRKREQYIGPWLPEPLPVGSSLWSEGSLEARADPSAILEEQESVSTAFLLMLEKTNPMERAVFILHDILGYSYREVSQLTGKTEVNCRKIGARARAFINEHKPRFTNDNAQAFTLLEKFFDAAKQGDEEVLEKMLAKDSEFWSDGGGKVVAVGEVIREPNRIALLFSMFMSQEAVAGRRYRTEFSTINHKPGFIISVLDDARMWKLETVFSFEICGERIARIFSIRNPDKLKMYENRIDEKI